MLLNVCRHADKSVRRSESPGETLFVSSCSVEKIKGPVKTNGCKECAINTDFEKAE